MASKKRYRTERLQIMLDESELAAIEDWRFRMRMPTRTAAVRELLRLGFKAAQRGERAHEADLHSKSTDFTILEDEDAQKDSEPVVLHGPRKAP